MCFTFVLLQIEPKNVQKKMGGGSSSQRAMELDRRAMELDRRAMELDRREMEPKTRAPTCCGCCFIQIASEKRDESTNIINSQVSTENTSHTEGRLSLTFKSGIL